MYQDVFAQLADYRGVLGWNAFVDASGFVQQAVEVPMFIKEHSLPSRKPKVSEVYTSPMLMSDGINVWNSQIAAIFEGAPDPLSVDISGWIITPTQPKYNTTISAPPGPVGSVDFGIDAATGLHVYGTLNSSWPGWRPVDTSNNALNLGNVSYADIVTMYISGQMNVSSTGYPERRDPDYYISPYGQKYLSPVIAAWEPSQAPVQKKHPFSMTLYLEK